MPQIIKSLFITLAISLALLASLGSAMNGCEVCVYDGTVYNSRAVATIAEHFCNGVAKQMAASTTKGKTCTYQNWNTAHKDNVWGGQKTLCRIQCDDPTPCAPQTFASDQTGGSNAPHTPLIRRVDLACNLWPNL